MAVFTFSGRPPQEAVAFLEEKTPNGRFSFDWRDVWQEEHLTSFVVAKAASAELLADIQAALVKAIREGETLETFRKGLRPLLEARGWWGRKEETDPLTGEVRQVQLGSPRRLQIIYDTNLRMAHAAGRWARIEETRPTRPYLVYSAVLDGRTRPQHAAWGGRGGPRIILPVDHPFWRTHYPPNGWRCRCIVISASPEFLKARGLEVTSEAELEATGWSRTRPWLNRRNGRTETVPVGIDPGFAYNVGQARRRALTPPPTPAPQRESVIGERFPRRLPTPPRPRPYPQGVSRRDGLEGPEVFNAFARTLGVSEGGVFFDKVQIPLVIDRRLFEQRDARGQVVEAKADKRGRAPYAEVLAATLRDPDEIWVGSQIQRDGEVRLVRYYAALFEDPEAGPVWAVLGFRSDGWWGGVTAFPAEGGLEKQTRYLDRTVRVGTLVYRRPGADARSARQGPN